MPVITAATDVILIVISLDIRPYEACKVLPSPNITEGDIINSFFIQGGMIPGNPTFPSSFNSIVNSSGLPYILLISCRFFSTQLVTKNGSFLMSSGVTKYHIHFHVPSCSSLSLEVLGSPSRPRELTSSWKLRIELRRPYLFMEMEVGFNNVHVPVNNG